MKKMHIALFALFAATLLAPSCGKENDQNVEEAQKETVTFPTLDTFMPEHDVVRQRKSPKRGVCTNFRVSEMPSMLGAGVSWCYNWGHGPISDSRKALLSANGMEFVPMIWNGGFSLSNLSSVTESGYVLAYNEPNLTDQANMTPAQAAASWPTLLQAARSLNLKIVGPAMNYGTLSGYNDPVKWYDEFLAQPGVSLDDLAAIALHCYMPNGAALKSLMIRKFAKYGKPIWLTEFENGEARNVENQTTFLEQTITYLEADPAVERYAWFMDNTGSNDRAPHFPLITVPSVNNSNSEVTNLGRLYMNMSSFDKELYYPVDENIPAEHYNGQIIEETASKDEWGPLVETRVTSDIYGDFEIFNLRNGNWVEYNVDVPATSKYRIDFRYYAADSAIVMVECPGVTSAIVTLPATGRETWATYGAEMVLPKGKQTIRLNAAQGEFVLNWLRFTSPL